MSCFFSSRRRHTRLTCDWSSDVCSSDLAIVLSCAIHLAAAGPARPADPIEGKWYGKAGFPADRVDLGFEFAREDRKSTRLNSSHMSISYAVFCLKKKKE